jgi:pimeloyl-ACP methyl ester carboxylesterase
MRFTLLAVSVAFLSCGPQIATKEAQLPVASLKDVWVIVLHGSGDNAERWPKDMVETLRGMSVMPERVEWIAYDWSEAALDRLTVADNGELEGRAIAAIIRERGLSHVHVIGHSAAAHVAEGIEAGLAEMEGRPTLHLSLLDPYLGRDLDFNWGKTRIGTVADFTDQWLNIGDGVPGTDAPITSAHVFDVTKAPGAPGGRKGHFWPTQAYLAIEPGPSLGYEMTGTFDLEALRAAWPVGATEKR